MKITKENIQAFLPIKAYNKHGQLLNLSKYKDGVCYFDDLRINFENVDFTNSLKPYTDLTEQDWREVFEAGGAEDIEFINTEHNMSYSEWVAYNINYCSMPYFRLYIDGAIQMSCHNQLAAFMKLIEELKA